MILADYSRLEGMYPWGTVHHVRDCTGHRRDAWGREFMLSRSSLHTVHRAVGGGEFVLSVSFCVVGTWRGVRAIRRVHGDAGHCLEVGGVCVVSDTARHRVILFVAALCSGCRALYLSVDEGKIIITFVCRVASWLRRVVGGGGAAVGVSGTAGALAASVASSTSAQRRRANLKACLADTRRQRGDRNLIVS